MILILVVAGILALFFKSGDGFPVDSVAIFSIVVLFVVLGVVQEFRAQRAIAALKQIASPTTKVLRHGRVVEVPARELVPGDVVRLETGSIVPADCRIVESVNLRIQEAALTGESEPIEKTADALTAPDLPLGDRTNMGYLGTFATYGRGTVVVVSTGMRTELGRIAELIQSVEHEPTPLQRRLDGLGKTLAGIAVLVAVAVALTGLLDNRPWQDLMILAISIAVAIVPEGLPAVLTFSLAIGAQRMLRRHALIRKLPAVETLGSVTVICSDKTGTLTQNRMTVTHLFTLDEAAPRELEASPAAPPSPDGALLPLVAGGALCNDAVLGDGHAQGVGDPTEVALLLAARRFGLTRDAIEERLPRVHEFGFDSDRKLMTTVHRLASHDLLAPALASAPFVGVTKGAPDRLLAHCDRAWVGGRVVALAEEHRARIEAVNRELARKGIRVLGLAVREHNAVPDLDDVEAAERDLVFVGLVGMIDPPRPEAREAVAKCKTAGIRVVMITGDHPETARSIAADLGIVEPDGEAIAGAELDRMTKEELKKRLETCTVFARVSPEHKLRIVEALQEQGHIVAMTGDGVNDAPALKKADIGVAMGTGTDVAKEAADMVLVDDNFATIVAAVEEGRVVYDNLKRFVMFSIAGNVAKVMAVAVPPLLGFAALLRPVQILFSNLLTDGLLGLGMGMEAAEKDTMNRPPYRPGESIWARGVGRHVAVIGPLIGLLLILYGAWQWQVMGVTKPGPEEPAPESLLAWGTLMFTTMAIMQLGRAFCSRSFRDHLFAKPLTANRALLVMAVLVLTLQLLVVYVPSFHAFFWTTFLDGPQLLLPLGFAALTVLLMEGFKAWERARAEREPLPERA